MKLYECVTAYQTALDWIDEHPVMLAEAGGEIPHDLAELIDSTEADLNQKVENVALVIRNQQVEADAIKAEASRLADLAASRQRQVDSLKAYLRYEMDRAGVSKVEGALVKVRVQKNGRPSMKLADPDFIPEVWRKTVVTFDSQEAYQRLKVAGVLDELKDSDTIEKYGVIVTQGKHLRIY